MDNSSINRENKNKEEKYMKRFCWCLSLGVGCIIISFVTLLLGFLHTAEFFRLKSYSDPAQASVWPNLLWGLLHLLASLCLSYSLLATAIVPVLAYLLIESCYLIYALIYASVSSALKTNVYANLGLAYGILFWIYEVSVCLMTFYFLLTATSFYFLKRQQRNNQQL